MTPCVPDLESLRRANSGTHSRVTGTFLRMKAVTAPSEREDTLAVHEGHIVFKEHPSTEERPMCAERTVTVSQEALRHIIAGTTGLLENAVTALVTIKGYNRITRTDDQLQATMQALIDKTIKKNEFRTIRKPASPNN